MNPKGQLDDFAPRQPHATWSDGPKTTPKNLQVQRVVYARSTIPEPIYKHEYVELKVNRLDLARVIMESGTCTYQNCHVLPILVAIRAFTNKPIQPARMPLPDLTREQPHTQRVIKNENKRFCAHSKVSGRHPPDVCKCA